MNNTLKLLHASLLLLVLSTQSQAADSTTPVKVFILAGQSNMEGQAVVDLEGTDYNNGKGTLATLMADPSKAPELKHLKDASGHWRTRDDVWVRYQRENAALLAGPLAFGFSVYGDAHHFGPELQFGHIVGDHFANPVLIIKTAWGGKSLFQDFRPPSAGGETGKYYTLMIAQIREALANFEKEFPSLKGRRAELAGFVWYQGWNDGVSPKTAVPEYEQNLTHLIHDVRREFKSPTLPVVIGELTGPWVQAEGGWDVLRKAQAAVATHPEFAGNVLFVPTHEFVRKPEDSPNPGHGHHEFGNAETYFLVGDALGKGMISLIVSAQTQAIHLSAPLDFQVIQRTTSNKGTVKVAGSLANISPDQTRIEVRIVLNGKPGAWKRLKPVFDGDQFQAAVDAPAGGWHRLEFRALSAGKPFAETAVEHVGVGEVFVVAGQSNSGNYGAEKQTTKTGRVATFDGVRWQLANDPQPGAGGNNGSFMPPFGDAIAEEFNIPVGFVACGLGGTSVREWLPNGTHFPNPPTVTGRVKQLPNGEWESNGEAFNTLLARTKQLGPHGFRALLWHQGESDASQKDPTRTLAGNLYHDYLNLIITEYRKQVGWNAPWFVAQVSYHVPGDESSPDIRAAQASLWADGTALEGPDTDQLKSEFRDSDGKGVHFGGPGLREHARQWVEKVSPWLKTQLR